MRWNEVSSRNVNCSGKRICKQWNASDALATVPMPLVPLHAVMGQNGVTGDFMLLEKSSKLRRLQYLYESECGYVDPQPITEVTNVQIAMRLAIFAVLANCFLVGCKSRKAPSDLHIIHQTGSDWTIEHADVIVVGYETARRDVRGFSIPRDVPRPMMEMLVTLKVWTVLKGPPDIKEVSFQFYDDRGFDRSGPPQGPSGGPGVPGIFLLRAKGDGFHSVVDGFRPDIEVAWPTHKPILPPCATPRECIASVLFVPPDNEERYLNRLSRTSAAAWGLIGYLETFKYMSKLTTGTALSESGKDQACRIVDEIYMLELPKACYQRLASMGLLAEHQKKLDRRRMTLFENGPRSLRVGLRDYSEAYDSEHLALLTNSLDTETRSYARKQLAQLSSH